MNNKWKWVYNPFDRIAGWKAFGIGLIIMCITTVIGYFCNAVLYGIEIKNVSTVTWSMAFSVQALGLAVMVLVMWIIALLSAKHVRFQDILGTVTLAKYPLILAPGVFLAFNKWLNTFNAKSMSTDVFSIVSKTTVTDYVFILVFAMLTIPIMVWHIALLYNAFRVSTNLNGVKCALLFTTALVITTIIIYVLLFVIY